MTSAGPNPAPPGHAGRAVIRIIARLVKWPDLRTKAAERIQEGDQEGRTMKHRKRLVGLNPSSVLLAVNRGGGA